MFELQFELEDRIDVRSIVLVQDLNIGGSFSTELLWNFEIYVGDDDDYTNNETCPGGPFLPNSSALTSASTGMVIDCELTG